MSTRSLISNYFVASQIKIAEMKQEMQQKPLHDDAAAMIEKDRELENLRMIIAGHGPALTVHT